MTIYSSKIVGKNLKAYIISFNEAKVVYYLKFDNGTMPNTQKSKLLTEYTSLFLNAFQLVIS